MLLTSALMPGSGRGKRWSLGRCCRDAHEESRLMSQC